MAWTMRVAVCALLVGCGGAKEAKVPAAGVEPAPAVIEEAPDLSPVARPAEVVVLARLARPRLALETVAGWSGLPLRIEDALPPAARGLAQAVLWEAPIEAVVALDAFGEGKVSPPLAVVSVGLKSLADGLDAAERMQLSARKLAPGVYRVGELGDLSCAVAASVGSAPARLVCGRAQKDVDVLLGYATRGLPSEPQTGADFELTLDAAPIQKRYERDVAAARLFAGVAIREVALDSPRFDRALGDAVYGLVDELTNVFQDLERLRLEVRLDASQNKLAVAGEARLKGQASWTSQTMATLKPEELPATLPRLPQSTLTAYYTTSSPAERLAVVSRVLGELLEGYLEHEKLPEATRKRVRRISDAWLAKSPSSFGFTTKALKDPDPLPYFNVDPSAFRIAESQARMSGILNELQALLGDPALKRWAKQEFSIDASAWPKLTKKALKVPGFKAGATAYELSLDLGALAKAVPKLDGALPKDSKGPERLVFVLVPDGDAAHWLAAAVDEKEALRALGETQKTEPGAFFATPARRGKLLTAGFLTLQGLVRSLERSLRKPGLSTALGSTPRHGETPMPFATTGGPGVARFELEVPAAVFGDATALGLQAQSILKTLP